MIYLNFLDLSEDKQSELLEMSKEHLRSEGELSEQEIEDNAFTKLANYDFVFNV